MSSGKTPHAQAANAQTQFKNTNQTSFGSDFGSGTSSLDPKTGLLSTNSTLSDPLKQVNNTATQGLQANMGYLSKDPSQQFASIQAGENPYYNAMAEQTRRSNDQAISAARLHGQATGNNNSTLLGAQMGRIQGDNQLQQNQNAANAFTLGNQTANQNAGTQMGAVTSLANLSLPMGSSANSNLMTALAGKDANSQYNASNQQAANLANQQADIQAKQAKSQMWGNIINGGLTAAGTVFGGPLGGMIAGKLGGMATGAMGMGSGSGSGGGMGSGLGSMAGDMIA